MSEEPRYLVRNRRKISLLLEIQELRLVLKAQLFDGTVMAVSLSPRPSHRVAPYDVYVIQGREDDAPEYYGYFVTYP